MTLTLTYDLDSQSQVTTHTRARNHGLLVQVRAETVGQTDTTDCITLPAACKVQSVIKRDREHDAAVPCINCSDRSIFVCFEVVRRNVNKGELDNTHYSFRPRQHSKQLISKTTELNNQDYIVRNADVV